jgi:hypothetical protein
MIVVAVLDFDVHARVGHPSGDFAQLTGLALTQSLNEHIANGQHADPCRQQGCACHFAVCEEKVSDAIEDAAAFDAHAGTAERLPHFGERAGVVLESDGQVLHAFEGGC